MARRAGHWRGERFAGTSVNRVHTPGGRDPGRGTSIQGTRWKRVAGTLNLRKTAMKRLLMLAIVGAMLSTSTGCCLLDRLFSCHGGCAAPGGCQPCQAAAAPQGPAGPPVGQVAYPYYANRGPTDFFYCGDNYPGP